jgi:hypothetical protein
MFYYQLNQYNVIIHFKLHFPIVWRCGTRRCSLFVSYYIGFLPLSFFCVCVCMIFYGTRRCSPFVSYYIDFFLFFFALTFFCVCVLYLYVCIYI